MLSRTPDAFESAEWHDGSYYDSVNPSNVGRKYCVIPCKAGDTFTLHRDGSWTSGYLYYADSSGVIDYTAFDIVSSITIHAMSTDRTPSELRFTVVSPTGGAITDDVWANFDMKLTYPVTGEFEKLADRVSIIETNSVLNRLKIGTFNVGLWYNGVDQGVPNAELYSTSAKWRRMLGNDDCDLICLQEAIQYFDRDKTIDALPHIFSFKYENIYAQNNDKAFISKRQITDITYHSFASGRKYAKGYFVIDNKRICVINAHTSSEVDFNTHRKAEFEELVSIMGSEEYAICCGDFNAFSKSEFDIFKNGGLKIANGDLFGWFDTWTNLDRPTSGWDNLSIDNIVTTANISIQNVVCDRQDLSDHNLLFAELLIN